MTQLNPQTNNCSFERSGVNILEETLCRELPFKINKYFPDKVDIDFPELKKSGFLKPQIPDAETEEDIIELIKKISKRTIMKDEIKFLGKFWLPKSVKTSFYSWTTLSSKEDSTFVFVLESKNNVFYILEEIPCEFCGTMLNSIHESDGWVCDRCYDEEMCVSESDDEDPYKRHRVYYKDAKR